MASLADGFASLLLFGGVPSKLAFVAVACLGFAAFDSTGVPVSRHAPCAALQVCLNACIPTQMALKCC